MMGAVFSYAMLWRSLVVFLLLGSVAGLLAGAVLLWRPDWLVRVSQLANSWVSTRQMSRPLDRTVDVDQWFYRYSLLSGALLLAGAIYIDYIFTVSFDKAAVLATLRNTYIIQPLLLEVMLDALVLIFLAGAQLALLVSLFLLFRPSMLRDFEQGANQRLSLRLALKPLEMQHSGVDQYVFKHVQGVGLLLLFGSLYTLVALVLWLGR